VPSQLSAPGELFAEAGEVLEDRDSDSVVFQAFHVIPH
jgi:hypothetical protein